MFSNAFFNVKYDDFPLIRNGNMTFEVKYYFRPKRQKESVGLLESMFNTCLKIAILKRYFLNSKTVLIEVSILIL